MEWMSFTFACCNYIQLNTGLLWYRILLLSVLKIVVLIVSFSFQMEVNVSWLNLWRKNLAAIWYVWDPFWWIWEGFLYGSSYTVHPKELGCYCLLLVHFFSDIFTWYELFLASVWCSKKDFIYSMYTCIQ